jgi:hypothetical protein
MRQLIVLALLPALLVVIETLVRERVRIRV